jgi:hypothetical protein
MSATKKKFAFILKTSPEKKSQALTTLDQSFSLDDAGHEVSIYLDAAGTQLSRRFDDEHPLGEYLQEAKDRDLIVGACGLCAVNYGTVEELQDVGVDMLGDGTEHSINVEELVGEGYELKFVS